MKKTFNNHDKDLINSSTNKTFFLAKFTLKLFNQLSYDRKIWRPLVASYLLDLLDHYSLKTNMKTINIALLQIKFSLILNG